LGEDFNNVVRKVMNSYNCKNYFLVRTKEYNPVGRFQTEEESDKIADEILELLNKEQLPYTISTGDIVGYDAIVDDILHILEEA